MAAIVNIEVDAGTSKTVEFDWIDNSTRLPMDLTTCTAKMQVRSKPGGDIVYLEYSTQANTITLDAVEGSITVFISPSDTTVFPNTEWRRANYDLRITDTASGLVTMIVRGEFTILPRVTI